MASNFFARQDRARTNTAWLVALFVVAVLGIVACTSTIAYFAIINSGSDDSPVSHAAKWQVPTLVAIVTAVIIVAGSLFKVLSLRWGGGEKVAESLGGVRVYPSTGDLDQQRLLNVVEEMALASGTPVPSVFLMSDETSINAFAAGYSPNDAVIGVTRGAVQQLTRDQLQGVIAHEFSHILNGDMRIGIRLIGVLHGILILGLLGRMMFHIFARSGTGNRGNSNGKGGGQILIAIIVIGVALIVIGAIGSFIGSLIKAAVSRQREFLADSSAVQFTRNPGGIAGALKRIGGYGAGSQVKHGSAVEVSHMFFAQGITSGFASWLATHPPLPQRILAIEPNWDRAFLTSPSSGAPAADLHAASPASQLQDQQSQQTTGFAAGTSATSSQDSVANDEVVQSSNIQDAIRHVGAPEQVHRDYAAQLVQQIPTRIYEAAHDPFDARAIIFALLLDQDTETRASQIHSLSEAIEPRVVALTVTLAPAVQQLPARLRLPIIDVSMPALHAMTANQFDAFHTSLKALIAADNRLSIFEWGLSQIVLQHLLPNYVYVKPSRTNYYNLNRLGEQVSHLLSMIAHVGNNAEHSKLAFRAGASIIPSVHATWVEPANCSLAKLEKDLGLLRQTTFKIRGQLIDACTAVICADQQIQPAEAELLRGIAELLDSPVPPILPGVQLA